MSTIAPGRLFNVADAASFVALSQQNWAIASEELFARVPTRQNGSPNTLNGPPGSGAWNVGDFWRDQNRAEFVCTVAGTPGTWRQIAPATVTADPAAGSFPTGYLILNVAEGACRGRFRWGRGHPRRSAFTVRRQPVSGRTQIRQSRPTSPASSISRMSCERRWWRKARSSVGHDTAVPGSGGLHFSSGSGMGMPLVVNVNSVNSFRHF